jgi:hypothetical protein
MRTIKHPLSGALYDLTPNGLIEVTLQGKRGVFTEHGVWVEGEIRQADPHLCLWIAGQQMTNRFRDAAEAARTVDAGTMETGDAR